ncbi:zinc-binding dehydrogenase [Amycolatopsis ultiminotia]|uniref:zinc-binding dehydrogenase n=1 Tax=Amycolatopsis ultiminotia TaxID=543629 RepID=UPI0031EA94F1
MPGEGQALVQVETSGVTFVETQVRAGNGTIPAHRPPLPVVLGNGVGGMVVTVGENVDPSWLGARVVTALGGNGGYAELAVADVTELIRVPEPLGIAEATALLSDGRTALGLVRAAQPQPGEWALVEAAAGGVGGLLVQLLHDAGARVIGAAGSSAKREKAVALGAEAALDYTAADWTRHVLDSTGGAGVDLAFDGIGGRIGQQAVTVLRDDGRIATYGMAAGTLTELDETAHERGIHTIGFGTPPAPETPYQLATDAIDLAAQGRLHPTIGQTFPLDDAADAHAAIEARATTGKTLLLPG